MLLLALVWSLAVRVLRKLCRVSLRRRCQAFVSSQAKGGRPNLPLTVDNVDVSVLNELPEDLRKEILGQLRAPKTRRDTKKRRTVADYFIKG